jgi:hypothetical protein
MSINPPPILYFAIFCILPLGHAVEKKEQFEVTTIPIEVRENLNLKEFYQKRVNVCGFSILSSKNVSNFALKEAAFLIRKMIGERVDLLEELNKNKARFVIMARNEFTTDIPEHANLTPAIYWDQRARGLGATNARPAVTCGEENLLGIKGDPYAEENILIHEFAHALHQMALNQIDPLFQKKIERCFEQATKQKIWEGTYASTNVNEYWAEGVQSWFNTNRENDREHGQINTRKELKEQDPGLAALIKHILGDTDWRYQLPQNRKTISPHLVGFQADKEKPFVWPKKLVQWKKDFDSGQIGLAPEGSPQVKGLSAQHPSVQRSNFSKKRNQLFFRNLSSREIYLEWIDFDGNPKQTKILRPRDHVEIQSFVGHVWQIKDSDSKKKLVRFILPKYKTSQFIFRNELNK